MASTDRMRGSASSKRSVRHRSASAGGPSVTGRGQQETARLPVREEPKLRFRRAARFVPKGEQGAATRRRNAVRRKLGNPLQGVSDHGDDSTPVDEGSERSGARAGGDGEGFAVAFRKRGPGVVVPRANAGSRSIRAGPWKQPSPPSRRGFEKRGGKDRGPTGRELRKQERPAGTPPVREQELEHHSILAQTGRH